MNVHLFLCVRTRNRHGEVFVGTVAALSLSGLVHKALTDFWLDAAHVSLETAGWWRGGVEEQQKTEPKQCRPVPRLQPLETPEKRKWGGVEGLNELRTAAWTSYCLHSIT